MLTEMSVTECFFVLFPDGTAESSAGAGGTEEVFHQLRSQECQSTHQQSQGGGEASQS